MSERARYEVDEMAAESRRQRAVVEALAAPLDDAAFRAPPEPNRWSVGDCLDHLTLINRIYLDAIADAMARARAKGDALAEPGRPPKRHGWLGDAFVRSLEPNGMKGRAFRATVPQGRPRDEVLRDFLETQDRLTAAIESARDLDLSRVRMSSPFFRLLRLSLGQAFGAVLAHNRRHIRQAERVVAPEAAPHRGRS